MAWTIEFSQTALRQLKKLERGVSFKIISFLNEKVATSKDPKSLGTCLKGNLQDLWRFRIGDYRIICEIRESALTVLVIRLGHRKDIYR